MRWKVDADLLMVPRTKQLLVKTQVPNLAASP